MKLSPKTITEQIVGKKCVSKTKIDSVVRIQSGLVSELFCDLEAKKCALLLEFQSRYPYTYIWFDDWNSDLKIIAEIQAWQANNSNLWLISSDKPIEYLCQHLFQGKWEMLFCDKAILDSAFLLEFLGDPLKIASVLDTNDIQVIVVSWYDNNEWLIGWTVESVEHQT